MAQNNHHFIVPKSVGWESGCGCEGGGPAGTAQVCPHVVLAGMVHEGLEDSRWPDSPVCCPSWNGLNGWGPTRMTGPHSFGVGWNHSYVWNLACPLCVLFYPHE